MGMESSGASGEALLGPVHAFWTVVRRAGRAAAAVAGALSLWAATPAGAQSTYDVAVGSATYIPGTTDIGNHDDEAMTTIALPFPVTIYDAAYTSATVSSNGFVQFGDAQQEWLNSCLPAPLTPPTIFAYWRDLRTDGVAAGQGVFTGLSGAPGSRVFVIEWRANEYADGDGAPLLDFEIIFREGQTDFDVVYNAAPAAGSDHTIGIQATAAGPATQHSCFFSTVTPGFSLRFTRQVAAGACCTPGAGCALVMDPAQCPGTSYFAAGVPCTPSPCPPPANDECAAALDLNAVTFPYTASFDNQTAGDDATDCSTLFHGLWFTYTAPGPSLLVCERAGGQEVTLAAASDCSGVAACVFGERLQIQLAAGETVKVVAGSNLPVIDPPAPLELRFYVGSLEQPPNDSCAGAVDLNAAGLPYTSRLHVINAGSETTDCAGVHNGVWYTFTASEPTILSWLGEAFATAPDCSSAPTCRPGLSGEMLVNAGQTVKVLAGLSEPVSDPAMDLEVAFIASPAAPNDTCATATDLTGVAFPHQTVATHGSSTDDDLADCEMLSGVWYSYTASQDCVLTCSSSSSSNAYGWAFAGSCSQTAACVPGPRASVRVNAGQTVKVLASGPLDADVTLTFDVHPYAAGSGCTAQPGSAAWVPGTNDTGNHGDEEMTLVTFPFPLPLYGGAYTSGYASSNGFLELGAAQQEFANDCLPAAGFSTPTIFAFWSDMTTQGGQRGIFTSTSGTPGSRTFVVEWRTSVFSEVDPSPSHVFAAVFYENQAHFDLVYHTVPAASAHTIGVQASGSGPATLVECFPYRHPGLGAALSGTSLRFNCGALGPLGACCDNSTSCSITSQGACGLHAFTPGGSCSPSPCPAVLPNDACAGALSLNTVPLPHVSSVDAWRTTPDLDTMPELWRGVWYTYTAPSAGALSCTTSPPQTVALLSGRSGCSPLPRFNFGATSYTLEAGETITILAGIRQADVPHFDVAFDFSPDCRADFDGQNGIQVADIFAFLRAWFAQNPGADFDGQNGIQVADIFAFLRAWFAGC